LLDAETKTNSNAYGARLFGSSTCSAGEFKASAVTDFTAANRPLGNYGYWLIGKNVAFYRQVSADPVIAVAFPKPATSLSASGLMASKNKQVFTGNYTGFTTRGVQVQRNVMLIPDVAGTTFTISEVADPSNPFSVSTLGTLACTNLDEPSQGFCRGTLSLTAVPGFSGKATCMMAYDIGNRDLVFCSAQNPSADSNHRRALVTIAAVSSRKSVLAMSVTPVHLDPNASSGQLCATVENMTSRAVDTLTLTGNLSGDFSAVSLSGSVTAPFSGLTGSVSACGTSLPAFSKCKLCSNVTLTTQKISAHALTLTFGDTPSSTKSISDTAVATRGVSNLQYEVGKVTQNKTPSVKAVFANGTTQNIDAIKEKLQCSGACTSQVGTRELAYTLDGLDNVPAVGNVLVSTEEELCYNEEDDDNDGTTDCQDSDCDSERADISNASLLCNYSTERDCSDAFDNDKDSATDCDDSDCVANPLCAQGCSDNDVDGYSASSCGGSDCNDYDSSINPGASETCSDSVDNNCNGQTDENCYPCMDNDGDGYGYYCANGEDCDDWANWINPGASEIWNGYDDNCNGQADEGLSNPCDQDGDGWAFYSGDCNEADGSINPGASETCSDSVDNNCDGQIDEGCVNWDQDGDGWQSYSGDCNDADGSINPGASETCSDSVDNNCNGQTDEGCSYCTDSDSDGYSDASCGGNDCNDYDSSIHPGVFETCSDSVDNNCNGQTDENCYPCMDYDGDGYGYYCAKGEDCADWDNQIYPGASEIWNGYDDNCNGQADEGLSNPFDYDGDGYVYYGYWWPGGWVDCNDADGSINPGASETCSDSVDNNCDGQTDEGCSYSTDSDSDGISSASDCDDSYSDASNTCSNNVVLELNGNGSNGSTSFVDSAKGRSISYTGNAQISTAQSKFGGGSIFIPSGNNSALKFTADSSFNFGSSDFTIEFWIKRNGAAEPCARIIQLVDGDVETGLWLGEDCTGDDNLHAVLWRNGLAWANDPIQLGSYDSSWHHFALVRNGNQFTSYRDGVAMDTKTFTGAIENANGSVVIGGNANNGPSRSINAFIDNLKVVKGSALYTTNFTPPTCASMGESDADSDGICNSADTESCSDSIDNDGDSQTDEGCSSCNSSDSSSAICNQTGTCWNQSGCQCGVYDSVSYGQTCTMGGGGSTENCSDSVDNDSDASTDCQDADCDGMSGGSGICHYNSETCSDSFDNNGNAQTDENCNSDVSGGDPYFDDVRVLVNADQNITNYANGGTPTLTFVGGAHYSTSDMKFGSASAQFSPQITQYCDGWGCYDQLVPNYLKVNDNSRTIPANYTAEFWIKPDSNWGWDGATKTLYNRGVFDYGSSGIQVYYYNGNLYFSVGIDSYTYNGSGEGYCSGGGNAHANVGALSASTWHHVAAVREGNALRLYFNGTRVATATMSANSYTYWGTIPDCSASSAINIGDWGPVSEAFGVNLYYGDYVNDNVTAKYDDIRLSNRARYSDASFTLPTSPYPTTKQAVAPTISLSPTSYTLTAGSAMTAIVPSLTVGTIASCTVSPSLPAGLSLNTSTCGISGTPTYGGGSQSYTITPSNSVGTGNSVSVSIQVNGADSGGAYYSNGSLANGIVANHTNDKTVLYIPSDTNFNDYSTKSATITEYGGVTVSNSNRKYGTGSFFSDSSNKFLKTASNSNFAFPGDFTVEAWTYFTDNSRGYQGIVSTYTTGDQTGWILYTETSNRLHFAWSAGSGWINGLATDIPPLNTWQHIAVSRSGGTIRLFVDGVLKDSKSDSTSIASGTTLEVGGYNYFPGGERGFRGYIDDVRVTKGAGIYTSSFTPPTGALGTYGTLYGCYSAGVSTGTIDSSGTGYCDTTYYINGVAYPGLDYNGNGASGGVLFVNGVPVNGMHTDGNCYLNGTNTGGVVSGTGWCSGDNAYYLNGNSTTLSSSGTGTYNGFFYSNGQLGSGVVNGAADLSVEFSNSNDFTNNFAITTPADGIANVTNGQLEFRNPNQDRLTGYHFKNPVSVSAIEIKFTHPSLYPNWHCPTIAFSNGLGTFTVAYDPKYSDGGWCDATSIKTSFGSFPMGHLAGGQAHIIKLEVNTQTQTATLTIDGTSQTYTNAMFAQKLTNFEHSPNYSWYCTGYTTYIDYVRAYDYGCYSNGSADISFNANGTGLCGGTYYVTGTPGTGNYNGNYYNSGSYVGPTAAITIVNPPSNQTASGGSATFSIGASISQGASLSYQWQKQESGAGSFSNVSGATNSTLELSSLTYSADNGDVYRVVLSGTQGASSVTSSSATLTVPVYAPDVPTSVSGAAGNAEVVVSWTAPSSNGGSAITDYVIQYSSNSGSSWTTFSDGTSTATSVSVTGLTNCTSYVFRVAAVNIGGAGDYSLASTAVSPSVGAGDPYFSDVRVLLNADENVTNQANGGTPTVTFVGGANYSTSDKKFGTASAQLSPQTTQYCDGWGCYDQLAPNYLKVNETSRTIPANYTVEFWVKPDSDWSGGTTRTLYQGGVFDMGVSGLRLYHYNNRLYLSLNSYNYGYYSGQGDWACSHSGSNYADVGTLSANTWYHIAIVREGNALRLYFNGNRVGNSTISASLYSYDGSSPAGGCTASGDIALNNYGNISVAFGVEMDYGDYVYSNVTAKFDDIRISNRARYSDTTYTVPTEAFPKSASSGAEDSSCSGATEVCNDGTDNDSDGLTDGSDSDCPACVDSDSDTFGNNCSAGSDCNDSDSNLTSDCSITGVIGSNFYENGTDVGSYSAGVVTITSNLSSSFSYTGTENFVFDELGLGQGASLNTSGTVYVANGSIIDGTITASAVTFNQSSTNYGTIVATGGTVTFGTTGNCDGDNWPADEEGNWIPAPVNYGSVSADTVIFGIIASNQGSITNSGTVSFSGCAAANGSTGVVSAETVHFDQEDAYNAGQVTAQSGIYFTSGWAGDNYGTLTAPEIILDRWSDNRGTINGSVIFGERSINYLEATINGDCIVYEQNDGVINGYVDFAGVGFNTNTINGTAVFADSSYNNGTVTGDATFNGSSYNIGTVTGDATFNGSSYNIGTVTGTATYSGYTGSNASGYFIGGQLTTLDSSGSGTWNGQIYVSGSALLPPGDPEFEEITPGNASVHLLWIAPDNHGSAITDYVVQYSSNSGSTWTTFAHGTSTDTSTTVTGLTNGTAYIFRVAAVNAVGTGSYSSSSASFTPGYAGSGVWGSDFWDNGTDIGDYSEGVVTITSNLSSSFSYSGTENFAFYDVDFPSGATLTTTGSVTFNSTAKNYGTITGNLEFWGDSENHSSVYSADFYEVSSNYGTVQYNASFSEWSSNRGTVTGTGYFYDDSTNTGTVGTKVCGYGNTVCAVAPSAPTSVTGTSGNGVVSLSWSAPGSNGGVSIDYYLIQYSSNGGSTWVTYAGSCNLEGICVTSTSYYVGGLTNGTAYIFKVAAVNAVGTGSYSSNSASVTPRTTPGAPTSVSGTSGNAQVALSWTAPGSTGGSAITDYVIQYSSNSGSTWTTFSDGTSTATSTTVTGLTNGTAYIFKVAAVNAVGTGSYSSNSSSVTPAGAPTGAPTLTGYNTTVTSNGQTYYEYDFCSSSVNVSFSAGANGGSAITNYQLSQASWNGSNYVPTTWNDFSPAKTTSPISFTGLNNTMEYFYFIRAKNAVGTGPTSGLIYLAGCNVY
jgi:hypothetical protein